LCLEESMDVEGDPAGGRGYSESLDGGDTWERLSDGLAHQYLWGPAVDPADPKTVVVSAARGPMQAHSAGAAESTVYRREGRGKRCALAYRRRRERSPRCSRPMESSPAFFTRSTTMGCTARGMRGKSGSASRCPGLSAIVSSARNPCWLPKTVGRSERRANRKGATEILGRVSKP